MTDTGQDQAPWRDALDLTKPSAARMYDWYLGGTANYAVDRELGEQIAGVWPDVKLGAMVNRRWLGRVVDQAVRAGITQFIDVGAGLPTVGSTHQMAQNASDPDTDLRVVYVDNEHVAYSHASIMLQEQGVGGWCAAVREDARNPEQIFDHPETQRLLDLNKPVCVLTVALWQFIGGGDNVPDLLGRYRDRLASGSWIAISHLGTDQAAAPEQAGVEVLRNAYKDTQNPLWVRDHTQLSSWFKEMPLIEPGLVHLHRWRPDDEPTEEEQRVGSVIWGGVGQLP